MNLSALREPCRGVGSEQGLAILDGATYAAPRPHRSLIAPDGVEFGNPPWLDFEPCSTLPDYWRLIRRRTARTPVLIMPLQVVDRKIENLKLGSSYTGIIMTRIIQDAWILR